MSEYRNPGPTREEIDSTTGSVVLEFGTDWCGHCQAAQPKIEEALEGFLSIERIKVEDGKGRRLGRTFGVKLWPTLVFLKDGQELARVVRPQSAGEVLEGLRKIA